MPDIRPTRKGNCGRLGNLLALLITKCLPEIDLTEAHNVIPSLNQSEA